jgi:hypothetical protein
MEAKAKAANRHTLAENTKKLQNRTTKEKKGKQAEELRLQQWELSTAAVSPPRTHGLLRNHTKHLKRTERSASTARSNSNEALQFLFYKAPHAPNKLEFSSKSQRQAVEQRREKETNQNKSILLQRKSTSNRRGGRQAGSPAEREGTGKEFTSGVPKIVASILLCLTALGLPS